MFEKAMPTMPISALRNKQPEVMDRIEATPILLTHNGVGAGILVHPEKWNRFIDMLNKQNEFIRIRKALDEAETDPDSLMEGDEFEALMKTRGLFRDATIEGKTLGV